MSDIQAFPSKGTMGEVVEVGMTLRDYFAAKAMIAIYENPKLEGNVHFFSEIKGACRKSTAEDAYKMADAMLKARQ